MAAPPTWFRRTRPSRTPAAISTIPVPAPRTPGPTTGSPPSVAPPLSRGDVAMQRPMLPAAVFAVLGAGALLSQHQAVAQTIRYVDNIRTCDDLGPCYPKIMDAISAAEPSDTVEVFPGVYHEAVVFKSGPANIVLKAHIEALKPVIAPPGGQDAVYIEATPGVQLRNFVLEAPDANAVFAVAGASRGLVLDGNLIT